MRLYRSALKSLLGNGLKTWLNVFVLSISFVLILIMQGILRGWSSQAIDDSIKWEIGDGEYWHSKYDPNDFFSLDSSMAPIPAALLSQVKAKQVEPVLVSQASLYHEGRLSGIIIKGIRADQNLLQIPSVLLNASVNEIPVIMGAYQARQSKVKLNDVLTLQWRDKYGTFEAAEIRIVGIFKTSIPAIDYGQIWLPYDRMEQMLLKEDCANYLVKSEKVTVQETPDWNFKSVEDLTASTVLLVKTKSVGSSVMYLIFLLLAMLAIFDTQTLAIFRRQREIGTMIAMGMTQKQVVRFFTLEGTFYAILAVALGSVWGAPLFWFMSVKGVSFGMEAADFGVPMADVMYSRITPDLVVTTIVFLLVVTAIVSYLPARKIARLNPTDAIRGKVK